MKERNVLSLANPVRIPRMPMGRVSGTRIQAAVLTALALAAAAGCSSASAGSGGQASADQKAVAAVVVRTMHDLGTNNYADLCEFIAPGSPILAAGVEGCTGQVQVAMMGAGQQSGAGAFLSEASELTVNASDVVVNGDSATVPKTALLYHGQPVAQYDGLSDANLIRKNGQWYLVMGS